MATYKVSAEEGIDYQDEHFPQGASFDIEDGADVPEGVEPVIEEAPVEEAEETETAEEETEEAEEVSAEGEEETV